MCTGPRCMNEQMSKQMRDAHRAQFCRRHITHSFVFAFRPFSCWTCRVFRVVHILIYFAWPKFLRWTIQRQPASSSIRRWPEHIVLFELPKVSSNANLVTYGDLGSQKSSKVCHQRLPTQPFSPLADTPLLFWVHGALQVPSSLPIACWLHTECGWLSPMPYGQQGASLW